MEQEPPAWLVERDWLADAHCARIPREDDAAFFELLGPGKRWMDYRCDRSDTLGRLETVMKTVLEAIRIARNTPASGDPSLAALAELDLDSVQEIARRIDGSLSLRLLLESIPPLPGEPRHHLASEGYLAKRDGKHGDWLARLRPDEPCKTILSHMGKDTYAYVHPWEPRTLSLREAARIQSFPDWFSLGQLSLVDGFRVIGNAVPPLLGYQLAERVAEVLSLPRCMTSPGQTEVGVQAHAYP